MLPLSLLCNSPFGQEPSALEVGWSLGIIWGNLFALQMDSLVPREEKTCLKPQETAAWDPDSHSGALSIASQLNSSTAELFKDRLFHCGLIVQ